MNRTEIRNSGTETRTGTSELRSTDFFGAPHRPIKCMSVAVWFTHQKLTSRLATIIRNSFIHKNGNRRYKFLVLGREGPYFVKEHSYSKNKYTEDDIVNMLEFLVDIFVVFGGKVFQQIVGIPMGTNCAPLLADIFLYSYEAEFIVFALNWKKN